MRFLRQTVNQYEIRGICVYFIGVILQVKLWGNLKMKIIQATETVTYEIIFQTYTQYIYTVYYTRIDVNSYDCRLN